MTEPWPGLLMNRQTIRIVAREQGKKGTWVEQPAVVWPGALVMPGNVGGSSTERREFGQSVESRWQIFGPIPPVLPRAQDLVLVDGLEADSLRLHVEGRLQTYTTLHGQPHHIEGVLKLWEG